MDCEANAEIEQFYPLPKLASTFDCKTITLENSLRKHGIPITRLSERKRGLLKSDYEAFVEKLRGRGVGI